MSIEEVRIDLTPEEREAVRKVLGREPNTVEWAMVDAEWSEHCSYKSSKLLLRQLPTKGARVVLGPGFDAGVLDIGDGWVATIHIESHNHPSAIDPYGGAATGIGGVLRDILCMGTRPIALLDSLRFGWINRSAHSRWLFGNVVKGIADYGNCTGVPTVAGEVEFDDCFEANCLVDVICVGVGRGENLVLAEMRHPGDSIILVGGRTGRDGIHGVTFASRALTEESEGERSAVQIPDPFMKKLIIESTLEAVATGRVRGLKDLGGGGLTCGLSEMADKGGCGLQVDLAKIPLREDGMNPVEIMISESQERMVFVVQQGFEREVCSIFDKYELPYSIIGKVTDDGVMNVNLDRENLAQIPVQVVAQAPNIPRAVSKPRHVEQLRDVEKPPLPVNLSEAILKLLSSPNIASKRWVYEQYDHEVGVRTVVKPGQGGGAVMRVGNGKFIAVKVDGNSKQSFLDPYNGAAGCLAEACRNVVSVGAAPIAMVDHLQFGDPGDPEVYWTFSETVKGLADYCRFFSLPCVGGKVSFYNEDERTRRAIKPSPVVAVIGLVEKEEDIRRSALREGCELLVLGVTRSEMGGSEYYECLLNLQGGMVPEVILDEEMNAQQTVLEAIRRGMVEAVSDCSHGGLAVTLSEMCVSGDLGAKVNLDEVPSKGVDVVDLLFSESHGRFIVVAERSRVDETMKLAKDRGLACGVLGRVGGNSLEFSYRRGDAASLTLTELRKAFEGAIPRMMGGRL